jgi:hypothetical protein
MRCPPDGAGVIPPGLRNPAGAVPRIPLTLIRAAGLLVEGAGATPTGADYFRREIGT